MWLDSRPIGLESSHLISSMIYIHVYIYHDASFQFGSTHTEQGNKCRSSSLYGILFIIHYLLFIIYTDCLSQQDKSCCLIHHHYCTCICIFTCKKEKKRKERKREDRHSSFISHELLDDVYHSSHEARKNIPHITWRPRDKPSQSEDVSSKTNKQHNKLNFIAEKYKPFSFPCQR